MGSMKACVVVLALLSVLAARAEVKLADAVISDVGQICYTTGDTDTWMSWAAVDANIIQAWQDVYYAAHDTTTAPPNGTGTSATRGVTVYNALRAGMDLDGYSYLGNGLSLWMQGKEYLMPFGTGTFVIASPTAGSFPGYYADTYGRIGTDTQGLPTNECFTDLYGTQVPTGSSNRVSRNELKTALTETFAAQGYVAGLGIYNQDVVKGTTTMHALTCWGYETDADGDIQTLYLTDSFDETGLFKATLTDDGRLQSEDGSHQFDKVPYYLKSVTALKPAAGDVAADTSLGGHGTVCLNEAAEQHSEVAVGEGHILSAAAELSVSGSAGNGVTVGQGGYGFLSDVALTDNSGTGLVADGRTEVQADQVTVTGNARGIQVASSLQLSASAIEIADNAAKGNGGGMLVEDGAAVQLGGFNADVVFSGNSAALGGGLYNAGSVWTEEWTNSLSFSGNSAQQGSAIYNTGYLSVNGLLDTLTVTSAAKEAAGALIYNSGTMELAWQEGGMLFSGGTCAIENDGVLYLGVEGDAEAVFEGNSLRSSGTTYIGMDAGDLLAYAPSGAVFRSGGRETSIRVTEGESGYVETPAEFSGAADAVSLTGLSADSRLLHAEVVTDGAYTIADMFLSAVSVQDTAGVLTLNRVVLDDACTLSAESVVLDSVQLQLSLFRVSDLPQDGVLTLDASDIFTQGLVNGSLSLSCAELAALLDSKEVSRLAVDFGSAAQMNLTRLSMAGMQFVSLQDGKALFLSVPEPATATLSLLALAGLAARRRRR